MTEALFANEPWIRLGAFFGALAVLALWEVLAPRRRQSVPRSGRWPANLGIVLLDTALIRLLLPLAAVGAAAFAEEHGFGVLRILDAPLWLAIALSILLLDLAVYFQHVLLHAMPLLWRVHRMHHADLEVDVTTGLRFHPLEILLSMAIKLAVVLTLGAPMVAVLVFEVVLNATSMFNHSNIRLPASADALQRQILVTPDMHRVHHSMLPQETNSNFGFSVPWWDRLFGTYRAQPADGHEHMTLGIAQFRDPSELRLGRMLVQPFRNADNAYARGRAGIWHARAEQKP
jgi:sterol desaturase/sphingolipid hydroxylase (fatty acid hydroxylase superfamily)